MNEELQKKWEEAEKTGAAIPIGDIVVCDHCDKDYTDLPDSGGIIFGSYAYCPKCAPEQEVSIKRYGEQKFIRARCLPGMAFAAFVRQYRGPGAAIKIMNLPGADSDNSHPGGHKP